MSNKNLKAQLDEANDNLSAMAAYAAEADALLEIVTGELAIASIKGMIMEGLLGAAAAEIRRTEDEKTQAALIVERRAQTEAKPCIAKWAMKRRFTVAIDGLDITVEPEVKGRVIETTSKIDEYGDVDKTVSVLKGAALFRIDLPMFGEVVVPGTLERTETSYGENPRYLDIKNVAKFSVMIAGVERQVVITAEGEIYTKTGGGMQYGASADVGGHRCMWCGGHHRTEVFEAYVDIN